MASSKHKFDWKIVAFCLLGVLSGILLMLGWLSVSIVETAESIRIENFQVGFNETAMVGAMVEQQEARGMIPPRDEVLVEACHEGVKAMWESFQPSPGCSLIMVDENSKWMVCEGEAIYERIQEEWPYD